MTDLVIECPMCGKQNCIQVLVTCSIPIEVDSYDSPAAGWRWDEAEAVGATSQYECWQCQAQWQPNEMTADDFVKEYKDDRTTT